MSGESKGHVRRVPCEGGPLGSTSLVIHDWCKPGELSVPELVPVVGQGQYRLVDDRYVWEAL